LYLSEYLAPLLARLEFEQGHLEESTLHFLHLLLAVSVDLVVHSYFVGVIITIIPIITLPIVWNAASVVALEFR
jgi:hypothetical protein